MRGYGLLLAVATGGCGLEEWRNADLHLDIRGASLFDEDRVRLCVEGVGHRDQALGAGRVAFTGLPAGEPAMVTVEQLSDEGGSLGRAGGAISSSPSRPARNAPTSRSGRHA